jgi:hypothetical protein
VPARRSNGGFACHVHSSIALMANMPRSNSANCAADTRAAVPAQLMYQPPTTWCDPGVRVRYLF